MDLEIKCDKFEQCSFKKGEVLPVCRDYALRTGGVEEFREGIHVYCAFYKQVELDKK